MKELTVPVYEAFFSLFLRKFSMALIPQALSKLDINLVVERELKL